MDLIKFGVPGVDNWKIITGQTMSIRMDLIFICVCKISYAYGQSLVMEVTAFLVVFTGIHIGHTF